MSPKLPVISACPAEVWIRNSQTEGSHVRLRNEAEPRRLPVTVPLHKELAPGTLKSILSDAGISPEELLEVI